MRFLRTLWHDDRGAGLLSSEYLFLFSTLILGGLSGLVAVRQAGQSELLEMAQAILALNQSYSFSGQSNCEGSIGGASASDTTNTIHMGSTGTFSSNLSSRPLD